MNTMQYRGYTARIEYDDEDEIFLVVCWVFGRSSVFTARPWLNYARILKTPSIL